MRKTAHTDLKIGVAQTPLRSWSLRLSFVFGFCIAMFLSFYVGEYYSGEAAFERDLLIDEKEQLEQSLESESVALASARLRAETAEIAVNQVREESVLLSQQIETLERDLTYYQRVMSPIRNDQGLRIDDLSLEATSDSSRKRFNIVLTQLGKKNRTIIKGRLKVLISGSEQGSKKDYSLQDLKVADKDLPLNFRFKYFQELNEEFLLPEGFVPESVHLSAQSNGKKAMLIERTENWSFFTDQRGSL